MFLRWHLGVTAILAVTSLTVASPARANPYDFMGYDAETGGLANSTVSFGRSLGVLHTNPALLTSVEEQVYLGLMLIAPRMRVRLMQKPAGTDVPGSIYDSDLGATPGVQDRSLPTSELAQRRADTNVTSMETRVGVGFASSFGVKRLRVGVLLQIPLTGSSAANVATHYDDEREAAFSNRVYLTRFGQWDGIVSALAGVGYQLTDRVSIGFGTELAASAIARLRVYIPDAAVQNYSNSNLETHVSTSWRPVLGLRWMATEALAFGLAWRNESYFQVDAASEVTLWNSHEADPTKTIPKRTVQAFPIVFGYEPMEVSLGAGVKKGKLTAQVAATWQRWSQYLDEHNTHPEDAARIAGATTDTSRFRFSDTVSVQAGASFRYLPKWEASLGGAFYPSPVPAQVGRTNFADGGLLGVTLGQRHELAVANRRFIIALSMQLWRMLPRTTYKDPSQIVDEFPNGARTLEGHRTMPEAQGLQSNNPGFPGYTAEGWLGTGSVSVSHLF